VADAAITPPSRILVVMPRWVGDAVMATPLIEALHEAWPDAACDLLLKRYLTGLFEDAPWARREIIVDGDASFGGLRRTLARERYDLGVLLPNSFRPALLLWAAGVRMRVGYRRNGRRPLLSRSLPFPSTRPFRMIDFYGRIGERVGVSGTDRPMKLHVGGVRRRAGRALLESHGVGFDRPVVGLNPGAKYGSSKLWPTTHFAAVADAIAAERNAQVVVLAGPGEDDLAREIADRAAAPLVCPPSDEVDLVMLKAVLAHLDLLVSNDTGPRHMAAALGVPTVTVYGPTHAEWGANAHSKGEDISIPVDCGPCMERTCPLGHHRCMTDLAPARVVEATLRVLAGGSRNSRTDPSIVETTEGPGGSIGA
jgi:heptosyltransferase-2